MRCDVELDNPKILKSDLDRIFNETWWLNAFLASCNGDTDVAYAVIMECLKWRSSVNINRISLLELKPLLERRVAYLHGHDIQGSALLWINMAEHRSGDRDIDKLLAYWMERHYMERKAAPLAVLFDMNRMLS
ncbi:hypothetical protein AB6A40_006443 [Gnathostoma spinigerum]|uniref:CRAL-TRIO domain-containing protein n=1 Tax=Gnathostoma spinigerum TaxID=75299 RepID=A0ABD6ENK9_9BILA